MKHFIFYAAFIIMVSACSETNKSTSQTTSREPVYVKPSTVRPAVVPHALLPNEVCPVDAVNDQPAQERILVTGKSKTVKLSGWAGNVADGSVPQHVFIELDGKTRTYIKPLAVKRPDVGTYFNKPGLVDAGWEVFVDLSDFESGSYRALIIQVSGQFATVCNTRHIVIVN